MTRRVFVPEPRNIYADPNGRSVLKAERWGRVVPLTTVESKLGLEPDRIKAYAARSIATCTKEDFLLLDGSNVHCAVVASMIASMHDSINLLLWNARESQYISRCLLLSDIPRAVVSGFQPKIYITNYTHGSTPTGYTSVALTSGDDYLGMMEPESLKKRMLQVLGSSCTEDMLVPSGSKTHCVVGSVIMSRMHSSVNYLIWNHVSEDYMLRRCSFSREDIRWLSSCAG